MAIKLDISKAFDCVEWKFLEGMMRAVGFAEWWIHLIMTCVTLTSNSILLLGLHQVVVFVKGTLSLHIYL